MWANFKKLNSSSIKVTLINLQNFKITKDMILNLSKDFADLIVSGIKYEDNHQIIIKRYYENKPISLENINFIKGVKYNYKIEEKPYASINKIKEANLDKIDKIYLKNIQY